MTFDKSAFLLDTILCQEKTGYIINYRIIYNVYFVCLTCLHTFRTNTLENTPMFIVTAYVPHIYEKRKDTEVFEV